MQPIDVPDKHPKLGCKRTTGQSRLKRETNLLSGKHLKPQQHDFCGRQCRPLRGEPGQTLCDQISIDELANI